VPHGIAPRDERRDENPLVAKTIIDATRQ